ncbi:UNVERIFIED_CONTAM: hypothetical protein Sradi_2025300 [Sesamum radiatum]|uniref:Uncharacterized protein n=1 Tax=Sesamum radiatum TaxID=300843 RepID=A0AAW2TH37_SESRA
MTNYNNGGDHISYEGDSSIPATSGPIIPLVDPTLGDINVPNPDPAPGANALVPAPALEQAAGYAIINTLFCE